VSRHSTISASSSSSLAAAAAAAAGACQSHTHTHTEVAGDGLIDWCRGTQEVEAVLSEDNEETGAYDPLDRLKMAMNYEEKKVRKDVA